MSGRSLRHLHGVRRRPRAVRGGFRHADAATPAGVTGGRGGPGTRGAAGPPGAGWFLVSAGPDRDAGDCVTDGSRRSSPPTDSPEAPVDPPAVAASGTVACPVVPFTGAVASGALLGADGRAPAAAARSSRSAVPTPMPGRGPGPGREPPPETPAVAGADAAGAAGAGADTPASRGAGLGLDPWADCSVALEANASFSRLTTGASIVEDADLTNSPISLSLTMTALLSTPNSFASS